MARPEPAPSPAVAPPPGSPRFPLADAIRAIAVLTVVVGHAVAFTGGWSAWWGPAAVELAIGVQIFFILSGFLLYRPFVAARAAGRARPNIRAYARRRVLRIVPAYWLALTVLGLSFGLAGVWGEWLTLYGFGQVYSYETFGQGIPQAWSLAVEARCYLMLPLWVLVTWRLFPGRSWMWAELAGIAILISLFEGARVLEKASPGIFGDVPLLGLPLFPTAFALGMGLAVLSVGAEHQPAAGGRAAAFVDDLIARHSGPAWLAALACFLTASFAFGGLADNDPRLIALSSWSDWIGNWWAALLAAILLTLPALFGSSAGGRVRALLSSPTLGWIGVVSYGVFLWHFALQREIASALPLTDLGGVAANTAMIVLGTGASIAVAALSYHGVELWFLRRKEGRPRRPAPRPAPLDPVKEPG